MDLKSQTELNVAFDLDTETNILTVDIKNDALISLGTIVIENIKFRALMKALAFMSQERVSNPTYIGNWDASTNTPTLSDTEMSPAPDIGDLYLVSVAGTIDLGSGIQSYPVGASIYYSGSAWRRSYDDNQVEARTAYNIQDSTARILFG